MAFYKRQNLPAGKLLLSWISAHGRIPLIVNLRACRSWFGRIYRGNKRAISASVMRVTIRELQTLKMNERAIQEPNKSYSSSQDF